MENVRPPIYLVGPEPSESTTEFPRIDGFFDTALHIVQRTKDLAWEAKELIVAMLILLLLIQHSLHVLLGG